MGCALALPTRHRAEQHTDSHEPQPAVKKPTDGQETQVAAKKTFPECFPNEIIQMIFAYLVTPDNDWLDVKWKITERQREGVITRGYELLISPKYYDNREPPPVSIAFLRTCKTIHVACKDLIWTLNTVDVTRFHEDICHIWPVEQVESTTRSSVVHALLRHVSYCEDWWLESKHWSPAVWTSLKSVTVELREFCGMIGEDPNRFRCSLSDRELAHIQPEMFKVMEAAAKGWLEGVKRKVLVKSPVYQFDPDAGVMQWFSEKDWVDGLAVLEKVSTCFQAEVWLDGKLAYKDGKPVSSLFVRMGDRVGHGQYEMEIYHMRQENYYRWIASIELAKALQTSLQVVSLHVVQDRRLSLTKEERTIAKKRLEELFHSEDDLMAILKFAEESGNRRIVELLQGKKPQPDICHHCGYRHSVM